MLNTMHNSESMKIGSPSLDKSFIMQTDGIEDVLSRDPRTKRTFRGVFPSDRLPDRPKRGIYIINFDPSHKPGIHWVAVSVLNSERAEYFDSYAFPPSVADIITFLKPFKVVESFVRLQNYQSDLCGEFCCLYALFRSITHKPISQFTSLFHHPTLNDCIAANLFGREFGRGRKGRRCHPTSQKCCALVEQNTSPSSAI
jgi:hypothetical protein